MTEELKPGPELDAAITRQRQFNEMIEPIIKHKTKIAMTAIPTYTIMPDGSMETHWPKEAQEMFEQCDRWITEFDF